MRNASVLLISEFLRLGKLLRDVSVENPTGIAYRFRNSTFPWRDLQYFICRYSSLTTKLQRCLKFLTPSYDESLVVEKRAGFRQKGGSPEREESIELLGHNSAPTIPPVFSLHRQICFIPRTDCCTFHPQTSSGFSAVVNYHYHWWCRWLCLHFSAIFLWPGSWGRPSSDDWSLEFRKPHWKFCKTLRTVEKVLTFDNENCASKQHCEFPDTRVQGDFDFGCVVSTLDSRQTEPSTEILGPSIKQNLSHNLPKCTKMYCTTLPKKFYYCIGIAKKWLLLCARYARVYQYSCRFWSRLWAVLLFLRLGWVLKF